MNRTFFVVFVLLLFFLNNLYIYAENPCSNTAIADILNDLEDLYKNHVNISYIIQYVDMLLKACSVGDIESASKLYQDILTELQYVKAISRDIYIRVTIYRIVVGGLILLIPIAIYMFLPKIYLYIWYSTRKKWIIVKKR
jgi:hypothetical protein